MNKKKKFKKQVFIRGFNNRIKYNLAEINKSNSSSSKIAFYKPS